MTPKIKALLIILILIIAGLGGWFIYNVITAPNESEKLSCEKDADCVISTAFSDDCCNTCGSGAEAVNKIAAKKVEKLKNIRCSIEKFACPMAKCVNFAPQTAICRNNLCLYESDYIIKQAITAKNANICQQEKHDYFKFRCYHALAVSLRNPDICKLIDDSETTKADCYLNLAVINKDLTLCDQAAIVSQNIALKEVCYTQLAAYKNDASICSSLPEDIYGCKDVEWKVKSFAVCDNKTGKEKTSCYRKKMDWFTENVYFDMAIFCDKIDEPDQEACYRDYLDNYPR